MEISIIIISWNAREYLRQCLHSIVSQPLPWPYEILVVDNASSDGSAEMVEAEFKAVRLIRNPSNQGFAAGNNIAIRECSGRYIALVNSDVKVFPGCMEALTAYLATHPRVGNAGPLVLNGDLSVQCSCRKFPGVWNNFCSASGLAALFPRISWLGGEQMHYFAHNRTRNVDALGGCFWMIRRECLEEVGLLDESFFMYGEDIDWCRRCQDAGWKIAFVPAAQAIHYGGRSSANAPTRMAIAQQESALRYWKKHHGRAAQYALRVILCLRHLVRLTAGVCWGALRKTDKSQREAHMNTRKACLHALFDGARNVDKPLRPSAF
jgi:hypothetical protein